MSRWIFGVVLLMLVTGLSHMVEAQTVRGRLVGADADVPVSGALVSLEDSAGVSVAQMVTGSAGRFGLRAPMPGRYHLQVRRIGFHPWSTEVVLAAGEELVRTVSLSDLPVALPEIRVAGTSVCGERFRGDTLSAALWSQAGTALEITRHTVESRAYRFETLREEQEIARVGATAPVTRLHELSISAWPVQAPPAATLLANGFVENIEDIQVGPTWYGPDAEFLLSDPFFEGHCFRAVPPDPVMPPEWVGLAFEPAVRDARADIRGTLWLDRETGQLRRLNFEYTRIPKWARGSEATGELRFAPLPDGGWIVQQWRIRVPVPRVDLGTRQASLYGFRESFGRVTAVLATNGALLQRYP